MSVTVNNTVVVPTLNVPDASVPAVAARVVAPEYSYVVLAIPHSSDCVIVKPVTAALHALRSFSYDAAGVGHVISGASVSLTVTV